MIRLLVIGYGNELRRDDGLGPKLAAAIDQLQLPQVSVLTPHQLTPELADPISQTDAVVFIDASVDVPQAVQVQTLCPTPSGQAMAHHQNPSHLLALAQELFGRSPLAWWIKVPAFDLGFGEELSSQGRASLGTALESFRQLWREIHSTEAVQ